MLPNLAVHVYVPSAVMSAALMIRRKPKFDPGIVLGSNMSVAGRGWPSFVQMRVGFSKVTVQFNMMLVPSSMGLVWLLVMTGASGPLGRGGGREKGGGGEGRREKGGREKGEEEGKGEGGKGGGGGGGGRDNNINRQTVVNLCTSYNVC